MFVRTHDKNGSFDDDGGGGDVENAINSVL